MDTTVVGLHAGAVSERQSTVGRRRKFVDQSSKSNVLRRRRFFFRRKNCDEFDAIDKNNAKPLNEAAPLFTQSAASTLKMHDD